jgi:hypothetical protein
MIAQFTSSEPNVRLLAVFCNMPRTFQPRNIPCSVEGCNRYFTNRGGLRNHLRIHRRDFQRLNQHLHPPTPPAGDTNSAPHSPINYEDDYDPPEAPLIRTPSPEAPVSGETCTIHPLINGKYYWMIFYLHIEIQCHRSPMQFTRGLFTRRSSAASMGPSGTR